MKPRLQIRLTTCAAFLIFTAFPAIMVFVTPRHDIKQGVADRREEMQILIDLAHNWYESNGPWLILAACVIVIACTFYPWHKLRRNAVTSEAKQDQQVADVIATTEPTKQLAAFQKVMRSIQDCIPRQTARAEDWDAWRDNLLRVLRVRCKPHVAIDCAAAMDDLSNNPDGRTAAIGQMDWLLETVDGDDLVGGGAGSLRSDAEEGELVYGIRFDSPLARPEWMALGVEEYRTVDASAIGATRGLRIQRTAENPDGFCSHRMPGNYKDVRRITFVGKDFSQSDCFRIDGVATKGEEDMQFLFTICLGDGEPKRRHGSANWWVISLQPIHLADGWKSICFDLGDVWPKTIGSDNWKIQRLEDIALFGSLTMARITLTK